MESYKDSNRTKSSSHPGNEFNALMQDKFKPERRNSFEGIHSAQKPIGDTGNTLRHLERYQKPRSDDLRSQIDNLGRSLNDFNKAAKSYYESSEYKNFSASKREFTIAEERFQRKTKEIEKSSTNNDNYIKHIESTKEYRKFAKAREDYKSKQKITENSTANKAFEAAKIKFEAEKASFATNIEKYKSTLLSELKPWSLHDGNMKDAPLPQGEHPFFQTDTAKKLKAQIEKLSLERDTARKEHEKSSEFIAYKNAGNELHRAEAALLDKELELGKKEFGDYKGYNNHRRRQINNRIFGAEDVVSKRMEFRDNNFESKVEETPEATLVNHKKSEFAQANTQLFYSDSKKNLDKLENRLQAAQKSLEEKKQTYQNEMLHKVNEAAQKFKELSIQAGKQQSFYQSKLERANTQLSRIQRKFRTNTKIERHEQNSNFWKEATTFFSKYQDSFREMSEKMQQS